MRIAMVVPYQYSTSNRNYEKYKDVTGKLFLINILHQTATILTTFVLLTGCSLSIFYIKPQLDATVANIPQSCSLSIFYIKPQQYLIIYATCVVVPYQYSTSNRNSWTFGRVDVQLFLINILHQTATKGYDSWSSSQLFLINILHQTATDRIIISYSGSLFLINILHQTATYALYLIHNQ